MSLPTRNKHVPACQEDYSKLPTFIDHIKHKSMRDNPDSYFKNIGIVNFDIINHECRGDKLIGTYKDYKTIKG